MKFLLVTMYDINQSGGLSTFLHNIAKGLRKQKHTVTIVDERSHGWRKALHYKLLRNALYVLKKDWGMAYYFRAAQKMLRRNVLEIIDDDTVIFAADPVALASIKELPNKKLLIVQGDLTNMCLSDKVITPGGRTEQLTLQIEKDAYTAADHLFTCDTRLYNHVRDFVPRKPTRIKNFVDEDVFVPLPKEKRQRLRKRLGLSGFVVFCPRRLVPKNGVIFAAQAMEKLKDKDITLAFAGSGSEKDKIEKLRKKHGTNILLLGDIPHDDIVEYYQACDAVIIPSINSEGVIEATSISALEGMGCERPVIASGIGGLAELITDGKNGLLVKQKNVNDIAKAIARLEKDPKLRKKLGKNARTFVVKNNSIKSQTAKYLTVFKKFA